ncbi:hypothetical protein PENSPDRAFT_666106 [Peniophora sp. CONT]|nr:hypothetical protein PENSPDRAFT_666106 [Peniophora sp. CONT]
MPCSRSPLVLCVFNALLNLIVWRGAMAQNLTVPSSWDDTFDSSDTRAVREAYANGAAVALVNNITASGRLPDYQDSQTLASMYNVLALQDILSGNVTWKATVLDNMRAWTEGIDIYTDGTKGTQRTNSNAMQWALAFYYAYKAYGDTDFLLKAQSTLNTTYNDYITQDVVDGKASAGRNVSFGLCRSRALGGLFWLPDDPTNILIHTYAVGNGSAELLGGSSFTCSLAGLLYEETKHEIYRTMAGQTVAFMGGLNWDTSNSIEYDVYDLGLCDDTKGQAPGLQGWYIYALSIYASIVAGDNSALVTQLRSAIFSATSPLWTLSNGVLYGDESFECGCNLNTDASFADTKTNIDNGSFDDKAILIRGLSEALRRFSDSEDLVRFIEAFLTVQYNAATKNVRNGNSYSPDLDGAQAPASFSDSGNLVALDVLNAAFPIGYTSTFVCAISSVVLRSHSISSPSPTGSSSSSTPSSSSPSPGTPSSSQSSSPSALPKPSRIPVGAIAGGIAGGIAGLAILAAVTFCWRYKHRRSGGPLLEPFDGDKFVDPYSHPLNSYESTSAPPHQTAFAVVEPYIYPRERSSHPMSWPQYTTPHERRQQKIRHGAAPVSQAPIVDPSELVRMDVAPDRPTGAASPYTLSTGHRVSRAVQDDTPDLSALVNRMVNDALRRQFPPEYEPSSSLPGVQDGASPQVNGS